MKTLEGFDKSEHLMSVVLGLLLLAGAAAIIGIITIVTRELWATLNLKQFVFWSMITLIVLFISWNIGFVFQHKAGLEGQIFRCPCQYECCHPFLEWRHKRKCLSYVMNGRK